MIELTDAERIEMFDRFVEQGRIVVANTLPRYLVNEGWGKGWMEFIEFRNAVDACFRASLPVTADAK